MKECDLVMKGGISSGIVYPKAVGILSKDYVFKNIGGASAGAIAAAFTAAAEYQRQNSNSKKGFKLLNKDLPEQIGNDLLSLFQPHEKHSKVFKILVDYISRDKPNKFWFITKNIFHLRKFYRLPETLLKTNFGLCSGLTNNHQSTKGLTDWLNYWLEKTAGRLNHGKLPDRPLTFGDLKAQGIKLKVITTNVSTQQSTPLPFLISCHAKLKDLKNLLPSNLVKYLVNQHNSTSNQTIFNDDYLVRIPKGDEMPVLMAVRMSLSFPVLLAAFPIYQVDRSRRLLDDDDYKVPRLCWYSDGGITSNFPFHLFDNMFPSRPTFGISLDKYHEHRQESDEDNKMSVPGKNRVYLPTNANQGKTIPINTIKSFSSFLGSIFSSAQNWQDKAQSRLPGYLDRVVNIALKGDEGGLNLTMEKTKVKRLSDLGGIAGEEVLKEFNFYEHRWRRVLSAYAALEEEFESIFNEFGTVKKPGDVRKFLVDYQKGFAKNKLLATSYKPRNQNELNVLFTRLDALASLAGNWQKSPIRKSWGGANMPKPNASLRLVPGDIYSND